MKGKVCMIRAEMVNPTWYAMLTKEISDLL